MKKIVFSVALLCMTVSLFATNLSSVVQRMVLKAQQDQTYTKQEKVPSITFAGHTYVLSRSQSGVNVYAHEGSNEAFVNLKRTHFSVFYDKEPLKNHFQSFEDVLQYGMKVNNWHGTPQIVHENPTVYAYIVESDSSVRKRYEIVRFVDLAEKGFITYKFIYAEPDIELFDWGMENFREKWIAEMANMTLPDPVTESFFGSQYE